MNLCGLEFSATSLVISTGLMLFGCVFIYLRRREFRLQQKLWEMEERLREEALSHEAASSIYKRDGKWVHHYKLKCLCKLFSDVVIYLDDDANEAVRGMMEGKHEV